MSYSIFSQISNLEESLNLLYLLRLLSLTLGVPIKMWLPTQDHHSMTLHQVLSAAPVSIAIEVLGSVYVWGSPFLNPSTHN